MITLGIETSGQRGSVALVHDGELLSERDLSREGRRHARTLVAEIRDVLNEANLKPTDVGIVAVSIGPGSFTGLRVGVTCAKTWAYATGAAVVAVDTLQAVAEQVAAEATCQSVSVISDAQRGDLFVGQYRRRADGESERIGDVRIQTVDGFLHELTQDVIVTGPAAARFQQQLADRCQLATGDAAHPQAATIARIGEQLLKRGRQADLWMLEPLYLRKSAAEEQAPLK